MKEAELMAKIATAKQRSLGDRLAAMTGAAKRPELAKSEGINVKNPAAVLKRARELQTERSAWDNWSTNPELIAQIRAEMPAGSVSVPQVEAVQDEAPAEAPDTSTDSMFGDEPAIERASVEASQVVNAPSNANTAPPVDGIYKLAGGGFARFQDGVWWRGEATPQQALKTEFAAYGEMAPKDRNQDQSWEPHSGFSLDAYGATRALKPFSKAEKLKFEQQSNLQNIPRVKAQGGVVADGVEAAGMFEDGAVLTSQTREDVLAQQDRADAATKQNESQRLAADKIARDEEDRKRIAKASEAAAGTFELGGDALDNLTGQSGIFSAPAEKPASEMSASELLRAAADKMDAEKVAPAKPVASIENQTFDQWAKQAYETSDYKDTYLEYFEGNEKRATLGSIIGSDDNTLSTAELLKQAKQEYINKLLSLPRETVVSLDVWDNLTPAQRTDAQRRFYDLDGRITRRLQDDGAARNKAQEEAIKPYQNALDKVLSEIKRLDSVYGPDTQKVDALRTRKLRLENAIYDIRQGKEPDGRLLKKDAPTQARRTNPAQTIEFKNPIVGPSGEKLVSYTWQWKPFEYVDKTGEERTGKLSDWEKSAGNVDTGREVVHQFAVENKDGETRIVSAESAIAALGYANKVSEGAAKSAISAAKTLARNKMQLAELESALSAFTADQAEVNDLDTPNAVQGEGGWWSMGDAMVRQTERLFPNSKPGELLPERMKVLEEGWRSNRLSERGWNLASENSLKDGIYDTKAQIKRAQAKLDAIAPVSQPAQDSGLKDGQTTSPAKIENFGEELPPARRTIARQLSEDLTDDAIAKMPLSQVWPASENDAIEDPFVAAAAHVMREAIPSKPRTAYKVKTWVQNVQLLRSTTALLVSGRIARERFIEKMSEGRYYALRNLLSKIKLLEKVDRAQWGRIGDVQEWPDAVQYDPLGNQIAVPQAVVTIDGKINNLKNSGDLNDHMDAITSLLAGEAKEKRMAFEIRGRGNSFFINKTGDKQYRHLMEFTSAKEASNALENRYEEVVAAWEAVKEQDNITERDLRAEDNRPRSGKDWRNGKDVSAEDFQKQFGFKGGEFGKWVSQGKGAQERQFFLNSSYDALMDLADIVGIPPDAISLEGTLGIAFGSRGNGWASAHFEPSNLVINLTKPRGAGSLAHEWFHALDNYFARKRGGEVPMNGSQVEYRNNNYLTHRTTPMMVRKDGRGTPTTRERLAEWRKSSPGAGYLAADQWIEDPKHKQGVRAEVEERFENLVKALSSSPMAKRARVLDGVKESGDGYWSRTLELAARSFENYVQSRMLEQGYHNDFLANVRDAVETGKNLERYPYLMPSEIAPVADAFASLFNTIQTKETERGTMLFSRSGAQSRNGEKTRFTRTWYDRLVSLLPESYRGDSYRREPLPASGGDVQRTREVQGKVDALNQELRGPNDTKGYGPVSIDALGNLQVDARQAGFGDVVGGVKALADEIGYGVVVTGVRANRIQMMRDAGFESEISLAAVADRLTGALEREATNITDVRDTGTIMSYKPRGFPMVLFSRGDTSAKLVDGWSALAQGDGISKSPKSSSTDLPALFAEVAPGFTVIPAKTTPDMDAAWRIYPNGKPYQHGFILAYKDGRVELNLPRLNEGDGGSSAYAATGNWALNAGRKFAADRYGLSQIGEARRLENLASLAVKFGTTKFMEMDGNTLGVDWTDNDQTNISNLLTASYEKIKAALPEIDSYDYDFSQRQFVTSTEGDSGVRVVADPAKELVGAARAAGLSAGSSTIQRAILTGTLIRGQGLLQAVRETINQGLPGNLRGLLYGQGNAAPLTPITTIREALSSAYGKLSSRLEAKGLLTIHQTQDEALQAAAQARADVRGTDVETELKAMTGLDAKEDADGLMQGFHDTITGKSFLIADNLTNESAPGVLIHEVGVHAASDGALNPMHDRASELVSTDKSDFMREVAKRMDAAGETTGEEAAAYITEAYENNRLNAPKSVRQWIKDYIAAIRGWLYKKGILISATDLTPADIAAIARANARQVAQDGAAMGEGGLSASQSAESISPGNDFWRKIKAGESFTEKELEDVYSQGRRGTERAMSRMVGKAVEMGAGPGEEIAAWAGTIAGFDGYRTVGVSTGEGTFIVGVIPEEIFRGGDSRSVRETAIVTYEFTPVGDKYRLDVGDPLPTGDAFAEMQDRGTLESTGDRDSDGQLYFRAKLEDRYTTSRALLQESVRRLALHAGKVPTIIQGNRETGARADLAGNREYSADRVEMKFSGKGDQTNTAAFKRWFGDSKVVDEQGKPLVVYHGTGQEMIGGAFSPDLAKSEGGVFYFSNSPLMKNQAENANDYARNRSGGSPNVMPVFIKMENPLIAGFTEPMPEGEKAITAWLGRMNDFNRSIDFDKTGYYNKTINAASRDGYDGVIFRNVEDVANDAGRRFTDETDVYAVFEPTQIKSAIGNNGDFDGKNPDIRYSRSLITGQTLPTTWQAPDATKMDDFIYSMQDKHIDTKRVVKAVRDSIGSLADQIDPYLQEELFHGRAAMDTKEFLEKEVRPLLTDLQGRGIDISDFEEYLHNRHAERRNVQVAKINPAMPDGGSGIQTQDARAYLAGLPQAKQTAYAALARRVDAISKQTRDLLVSSGLEKQETIDAWDAAYGSEYVPLMREEMDNGMGIGQGFSVRGSSSKRAMGSDKPVANIIANIALQREKAITRSEKRKIGEALYGMVLSAPNPDFWLAIDPALQQNPAQITATAIQLVGMGMNPADADSIAREPTQRYVSSITGMVEERINPALRSADNVLAVRIDGEDKYVFFNAKDDRAMRMAKSLKNLDSDQLGVVMGGVAKMTRYFSAISTQYNPIFGVTNIIRDVQTGMLNLQSTALKGHQKDVAKNILPALRGIYIDLRDHRAGKQPTSSYAQLFEEFQREGGATGYRDMYANAEERADKIRDEIADIGAGKLKQAGNGIMGWLSDYNESMENAVRVSAYKVAKEQGMSNQQAASLAKNLTVNFNRKGQVALQAGAIYAFFNASVQGTARIAQTLTENGKLSSTGKNILKGGLLLGSMQALLLAGAGFDDEEPPDFVRERSLVIPIGDKKYVSIPMPLGFHIIPSLSRIPTEWALGGFKNTTKRIAQLAGLFADGLNPIGSSTLIQTMAPTVLDPIVALAENKDWTGKPIAKVDRDAMHPTAGHTRAKDTSTPWAKIISYGVNMATGGTDFKPGLASPTPDQIDYLIGQVTGGIGREVGKVAQVVGSGVSGEEIPLHKIPLVGRFVGSTEGQSAEASRFYNNLRTIGEHKVEIDGLRKNQRGSEISAYIKDNPDARLYQMADAVQRDVSKLNSLKRDLLKKDASPERIKLIDMKITSMMKLLNDRVRSMREMEPA